MLLANFLCWLWFKRASGFSQVAMSIGLCFLGAGGLAASGFAAAYPALSNLWTEAWNPVSAAVAGLAFSRVLSINRRQPWLYWLYKAHIASCLLALLASVLVPSHFAEARTLMVAMNLAVVLASLGQAASQPALGISGNPAVVVILLALLSGLGFSLLMALDTPLSKTHWAIREAWLILPSHILMLQLAFLAHLRLMGQDLRQAQEAAAAAADEILRERNFRHQQSRFLGMISHELKTPLAVIDSAAQSLQQLPGSGNPDVDRRHQRIRKSVKRIDSLLGQCAIQDRLDDAGLTLRLERFDVANLARALANDYAEEGSHIAINAPMVLHMEGDAALLRIALLNLIDNAVKYSPPATPIFVALHEAHLTDSAGVLLEVADLGPGIPPDLAETVFNPFVRGEHHSHITGTGLGLYLVRRIVELHGGHVTLAAGQCTGACFRICLPVGVRGIVRNCQQ